jgi:hypothetical protein
LAKIWKYKATPKKMKSVNGSEGRGEGNSCPVAFSVGQLGQHLVNTMQKITPIFLHLPVLAQDSG